MRLIFPVIYFALAINQFLALVTGVQEAGVHWILSGIIALIVAPIPIFGTIGGIYGAIEGWGWPWTQAAALFVGPLLFMFALVGVGMILEKK